MSLIAKKTTQLLTRQFATITRTIAFASNGTVASNLNLKNKQLLNASPKVVNLNSMIKLDNQVKHPIKMPPNYHSI